MKKNVIFSIFTLLIGGILYSVSLYNFNLFHIIIEYFTVILAMLIFSLSIISRKFNKNTFLINLGPGIFVAAIITFIHVITYKGMNIIHGYNANLPTQLWIILSYILAVSVLIAIIYLYIDKKMNYILNFAIYLFVGAFATTLCFLRLFPDCFIEGQGLTLFKIISEYIIILIYLMCLILIYKHNKKHKNNIQSHAVVWIVLFIASEFMFTLYNDVYGIQNFLGHYIRLVCYYFIYQSVVVEGIQNPYKFIFDELNDLSMTDGLTKLFNHRAFIERLDKHVQIAKKDNKMLFLMIVDVDRFKNINDTYGHLVGDKVLIEIAKIIKSNIRSSDLAFRHGGDEFSIIFYDAGDEVVKFIVNQINESLENVKFTEDNINISLSAGITKSSGQSGQELIRKADQLLYKAKKSGRGICCFDF